MPPPDPPLPSNPKSSPSPRAIFAQNFDNLVETPIGSQRVVASPSGSISVVLRNPKSSVLFNLLTGVAYVPKAVYNVDAAAVADTAVKHFDKQTRAQQAYLLAAAAANLATISSLLSEKQNIPAVADREADLQAFCRFSADVLYPEISAMHLGEQRELYLKIEEKFALARRKFANTYSRMLKDKMLTDLSSESASKDEAIRTLREDRDDVDARLLATLAKMEALTLKVERAETKNKLLVAFKEAVEGQDAAVCAAAGLQATVGHLGVTKEQYDAALVVGEAAARAQAVARNPVVAAAREQIAIDEAAEIAANKKVQDALQKARDDKDERERWARRRVAAAPAVPAAAQPRFRGWEKPLAAAPPVATSAVATQVTTPLLARAASVATLVAAPQVTPPSLDPAASVAALAVAPQAAVSPPHLAPFAPATLLDPADIGMSLAPPQAFDITMGPGLVTLAEQGVAKRGRVMSGANSHLQTAQAAAPPSLNLAFSTSASAGAVTDHSVEASLPDAEISASEAELL